jgi:glycosyltransferase involved in cell wall biosynthesis
MERDKIKQDYILITSSNFPTGGPGAAYLNLFCRGLKENHHNISVWLLKGFEYGKHKKSENRKNISKEGVPYLYLKSPKRSVGIIKKIKEEIITIMRLIIYLIKLFGKRKSVSILLYNNILRFNIPIFIISKLTGIKIICFVPEFYDKSTFEGSAFRKLKWFGFLFNILFLNKFSYRLIVFSHFLKDMYLKQGITEDKIIVQPNLTDFDYWQIKEEGKEEREEYTLGYCGTPTLKDGIYDLLQAVSELKNRKKRVSLLIIGDVTFGKSRIPDMIKFCESLNISELVTFTGLVNSEDVKRYLNKCNILVLTRPNIIQTQAGFPTKLGEYFASEKQILVTNFGDIEKYFTPMKELVTAECGNIEDIAGKIIWMLNNPEISEQIREAGYFKAKQLLSYGESLDRIVKLI